MSNQGLAFVIEDDFDASAIFAKALKVVGYETEVISNGRKALERLKEAVPRMVILDLHLPEVVGTDILAAIRADERLANTRVIIATADPRTADILQDDADLVLIKPTTFSQVRDFAERLTNQPRKHKTSETKPVEAPEKLEDVAKKALDAVNVKAKPAEPQTGEAPDKTSPPPPDKGPSA